MTKHYDWEQDAKDSYALAVACKREEWLVANVPGVKPPLWVTA